MLDTFICDISNLKFSENSKFMQDVVIPICCCIRDTAQSDRIFFGICNRLNISEKFSAPSIFSRKKQVSWPYLESAMVRYISQVNR